VLRRNTRETTQSLPGVTFTVPAAAATDQRLAPSEAVACTRQGKDVDGSRSE